MHISEKEFFKLYKNIKKIHFIGIASPFNSFCATHLISKGIEVTASEYIQDVPSAQDWIKKGVLYPGPHNAAFVTKDVELIIVPNRAPKDHVEITRADELGIPHVLIQELIGYLTKTFKTIAIAGTHGKTTTTALAIWLMHKTIGTPNFIIGDAKDKIGGDLQSNWESHPESEYLVIEACEYKKQFLARAPSPYISVITHIDLDHTDFYKSQEAYNEAFVEFLTPTKRSIIINTEKANELNVLSKLADTKDVISANEAKEELGRIESPLPGEHNQENLIRAAVLGFELGISEKDVRAALKSFPGITARFELIGETQKGAQVYWDYAHNSEKIEASLNGAREMYPDKKIIAVYQPHSYERTYTSQKELVKCLEVADTVILPNIYTLLEGDEIKSMVSLEEFAKNIKSRYAKKKVIITSEKTKPFNKTAEIVLKEATENSIIILISAGDLISIKDKLLTK